MKAQIGSILYLLFSAIAVSIILIGVFEAAIESDTPVSGLSTVFGGSALYLIGRDIRRILREN
jgi:hypothetical protein